MPFPSFQSQPSLWQLLSSPISSEVSLSYLPTLPPGFLTVTHTCGSPCLDAPFPRAKELEIKAGSLQLSRFVIQEHMGTSHLA